MFNYLLKIILAFFCSSFLCLVFGHIFLKWSDLFRSKSRKYTPQNHLAKNNTPTMGGLFLIASSIISILIFAYNITNPEIILSLLLLISFGLIGFIDDRSKILNLGGISEKAKFRSQALVAILVSSLWYFTVYPNTEIYLPVIGFTGINLGYFFIIWSAFIIIATSNAVNITDGLDGLAINSLIPNFLLFSIIGFLSIKTQVLSNILLARFSDISIISASLVGSCLGFLKFNRYPAKVFMGDVGSLPLGAALGFLAITIGQEFLLLFSGFIFVIETVSVILQVSYFKLYKKRLFKIAPFHHNLELSGYSEKKITKYFTIISWLFSLLALSISSVFNNF